MTREIATTSHRTLARLGLDSLPLAIQSAGPAGIRRFLEFFTATIRNKNTRLAYARAAKQFFDWCEARGVDSLEKIEPMLVAAYIEQHSAAAPTVKQHLAALRMLFDFLVTGHVLRHNPATSVRGPKHVVKRGKTHVLAADEARRLLDSIDTSSLIGLRDRALIGVMVYSFARVSAAVAMKVEDFYPEGKRWWLRLHEKGGKRHEVPAHHNADDYLDEYLKAAGIGDEKRSPLFRTIDRSGRITDRGMTRGDALRMVKRRAAAAAAYFQLYLGVATAWGSENHEVVEMFPTPRDAVDYILGTFPIVKRKEEQAHGDYRTKRVIGACHLSPVKQGDRPRCLCWSDSEGFVC